MNDHLVRHTVAQATGRAPVPPILPPVGGAVLLAARAAGWDIGPGFISTLRATLSDAETS
jgi:glucosamine kinase